MPPTHDSPSALAARVAARDDEAFVVLVGRYKPQVFRWAAALAGNEDDADDVTADLQFYYHCYTLGLP